MPMLGEGDEPPAKGRGSKLTPKMESFVNEYFIDFVGSEAVLRAGYKTKNPALIAARLLKHPLVAKAIAERKAERKEKSELKAEYLVEKLVAIIDDNEEKTSDQLKAIELAGKTLALWRDRQELSGPDGEAIRMEEQKTEQEAKDFMSSIDRLSKVAKFPAGKNGA